jgi:hypothetical protein
MIEETEREGMLPIWADIGTSCTILVEGLKAKRYTQTIILNLVLKKYELTSNNRNIVCMKLIHCLSLLLGPVMLLL